MSCVFVCQWKVRTSLVLSDVLCNGSSDAKASALLSSARENEGGPSPKGFGFATGAFSGQSFERLSESMLVTCPDAVSSVALYGFDLGSNMPRMAMQSQ